MAHTIHLTRNLHLPVTSSIVAQSKTPAFRRAGVCRSLRCSGRESLERILAHQRVVCKVSLILLQRQSSPSRCGLPRLCPAQRRFPAPSRSIALAQSLPVEMPTCEASSSTPNILHNTTFSTWPATITVTLTDVLRFFHVQNFSNASDEEAMFFLELHFKLLANAKILAHQAQGKCDRAHRALIRSATVQG